MKLAFLYAGQGSQHAGMGQDLYEAYPLFRQILDGAPVDFDLKKLCFEGPEDQLSQTRYTQPCMVAFAAGVTALLKERGIVPQAAAGLSLGEYSALQAAGVFTPREAIALAAFRGKAMEEAAQDIESAMYAVLNLDRNTLEEVCRKASEKGPVYLANYNCPGQVSVACAKEQLAPFSAAVKAAGGRALPLKVAGGFHSPFMASAAQGFAQVLADCQVGQPKLPLYSNKTGAVYDGDPKELLAQQIVSPVRWETIVRNMIAAGADTFIELGPGKTLCGLIAKTDQTVKTYALSTQADLEQIVKEVLGGC